MTDDRTDSAAEGGPAPVGEAFMQLDPETLESIRLRIDGPIRAAQAVGAEVSKQLLVDSGLAEAGRQLSQQLLVDPGIGSVARAVDSSSLRAVSEKLATDAANLRLAVEPPVSIPSYDLDYVLEDSTPAAEEAFQARAEQEARVEAAAIQTAELLVQVTILQRRAVELSERSVELNERILARVDRPRFGGSQLVIGIGTFVVSVAALAVAILT